MKTLRTMDLQLWLVSQIKRVWFILSTQADREKALRNHEETLQKYEKALDALAERQKERLFEVLELFSNLVTSIYLAQPTRVKSKSPKSEITRTIAANTNR